MKAKKNRENPIKISNYIKLGLLVIVVVITVLILRNIYLNKQNNELNIPVIRSVVTHEIKSNEIYNYLNENEDSLIYIGVSSDSKCRSIEKKIKSYIDKNNLNDTVIYLNLTDTDTTSFFTVFNGFYSYSETINKVPTLVYFKNGSISDVLSGDITLENFKEFLLVNGITK